MGATPRLPEPEPLNLPYCSFCRTRIRKGETTSNGPILNTNHTPSFTQCAACTADDIGETVNLEIHLHEDDSAGEDAYEWACNHRGAPAAEEFLARWDAAKATRKTRRRPPRPDRDGPEPVNDEPRDNPRIAARYDAGIDPKEPDEVDAAPAPA